MEDTEDRHHEEAGAKVLGAFFPTIVTDCVRYHVAAKRYLTGVDQDYMATLSPQSVRSLELQGGPYSEVEAERNVPAPVVLKPIHLAVALVSALPAC